jgi:hypothetical protein
VIKNQPIIKNEKETLKYRRKKSNILFAPRSTSYSKSTISEQNKRRKNGEEGKKLDQNK